MSIIFNGTDVSEPTYDGVKLDAVVFNDVVVFGGDHLRWEYKTGGFLQMTGNNSPSPFRAFLENAYGDYSLENQNWWRAFDGTTDAVIRLKAYKPEGSSQNAYAGVECSFGQTIRAVALQIDLEMCSANQSGIKLVRKGEVIKEYINPPSVIDLSGDINGYFEIDGIVFFCRSTEQGVYNYINVKNIQITKWYQTSVWKLNAGNLVKMTDNSKPSPFTASKKGWSSGSAWHAFDGSTDTYMASNNPSETGDITSTLKFGKEIRIAEITAWIGYGGPVYDNYDEPDPESGVSGGWGAGNKNWLKLYGIKSDGSQVLLATHSNSESQSGMWNANEGKKVHAVSSENQEIPFIGLTCHRGGKGGQGWYRLYDIQITKWYSKVG